MRLFQRTYFMIAGGVLLLSDSMTSHSTVAEEPVPAAASECLSFELDVMPVLAVAGCNQGACHGKSRGQNGFQLSLLGFDPDFDYWALAVESQGRRVSRAAVGQSLLLAKATALLPHGGGQRFAPDSRNYQILAEWISQGMPRRRPGEPTLVGIAVAPPETPVASEAIQLSVTASYSDGSTRDVSEMCNYLSSEPAVAAVSNLGLIHPGKLPGEASVMIRYMGNIKTWNVLIPRPNKPPSERYAALPCWNFIDGLIWQKLEQAGVLPSGPADDATFLRRAHLDTIGRLPTPEEARAFLADSAPDKRTRLVDGLLQRPEYGNHWANKWVDLLRPNPYRVGIKATRNFDSWIREAFAQNKPYDQFVRELVTAQGSTWRNGAAVLYRDRREPDEVAAMVSQVFLGVRLDCAKCHHHPFEVWAQEDFYAMAAYFARVDHKGTGVSPPISGGEEVICLADEGEVTHPLTRKPVAPRPLLGTAAVGVDQDPREVLAAWMTADDNPFFAKVAVNRLWAELMGRGLVEPVDDLRASNPPSNGPLLEALAAEFRRLRFDQKAMIRTIMGSYAYGLSSLPNDTNLADTRNYSRYYRTRLRAETLLDAITDVTGVAESFSASPPGSRAVDLWTTRAGSLFLDMFGRPDPNLDPPCERLPDSTIVQALHMMNSGNIQRKIHDDGGVAARLAASDKPPAELIAELYLAVYSRPPVEDELGALVPLLGDSATRRQTVEDFMWALLNTPEFTCKN